VRRLRDESGQVAAEFLGWIGWVLLAGLCAWQLLLAGWAKLEATNAARTGSRVIARTDGDPKRAAKAALPGALRDKATVEVSGDQVQVRVPMPVIVPSTLNFDGLALWGKAELPS
jgi:hypothetical protein